MSERKTVFDKAKEAGGDSTFCSHIAGIAQQFNLGWDSSVDHRLLPQIVAAYEQYTGKRYGGENLHSGDTIYFSQFVKSALEHWR
jgi:hypothetical protein